MNRLTEQLLKSGYGKDNFPEYIQEYNSFYDGFIYKPDYAAAMIFQTGCGLNVKGNEVIGTMSYRGQDWMLENDNPLIVCPYNTELCPRNHEVLQERSGSGLCFCVCHEKAQGTYDAQKTVDKVRMENIKAGKEALRRYRAEHGGHYCLHHMQYRPERDSWELSYKPRKCEACECNHCTLFDCPLSRELGNVYFDCQVTFETEQSVFTETPDILIFKGIPVLHKAVSITICQKIADLCGGDILKDEFYHPYEMPRAIEFKNQNLRATAGNVHDIEQDMKDVDNGLRVIYYDEVKESQESSRKKKEQNAFAKRVNEEEEFILQHGFDHLKPYEKRRIQKFLSDERIQELLTERVTRSIIWGDGEPGEINE